MLGIYFINIDLNRVIDFALNSFYFIYCICCALWTAVNSFNDFDRCIRDSGRYMDVKMPKKTRVEEKSYKNWISKKNTL